MALDTPLNPHVTSASKSRNPPQDWTGTQEIGKNGQKRDACQDLTVIIPAFNEALALPQVLETLRQKCLGKVHEIILIDDGSQDSTRELALAAGLKVISHSSNRGYGASLKTGIRAAQTPFILIMDAEGQHNTEDVWKLWSYPHECDMVVGARVDLFHSPLWRMPGKWLLTAIANHLVRRKIPDLNSGLRLFRKEAVTKYMHLCPNGFSFTSTITMAFLSRGYSVEYVPISVKPRRGNSTVTFGTGLDTMMLLLRLASLFNPLRIFVPLSLIIGLMGILWGIPFLIAGQGLSVGSLLTLVTAILLFALGMICDQISQLRLERFE